MVAFSRRPDFTMACRDAVSLSATLVLIDLTAVCSTLCAAARRELVEQRCLVEHRLQHRSLRLLVLG
jgi:hypothetical protein